MLTFPIAAAVFLLASFGAYGVHKRRKWAWYAGIVFQFFTASAISLLGYGVLLWVQTTAQLVYAVVAIAGAIAIWSSWVVWWAAIGTRLGSIGRSRVPRRGRGAEKGNPQMDTDRHR